MGTNGWRLGRRAACALLSWGTTGQRPRWPWLSLCLLLADPWTRWEAGAGTRGAAPGRLLHGFRGRGRGTPRRADVPRTGRVCPRREACLLRDTRSPAFRCRAGDAPASRLPPLSRCHPLTCPARLRSARLSGSPVQWPVLLHWLSSGRGPASLPCAVQLYPHPSSVSPSAFCVPMHPRRALSPYPTRLPGPWVAARTEACAGTASWGRVALGVLASPDDPAPPAELATCHRRLSPEGPVASGARLLGPDTLLPRVGDHWPPLASRPRSVVPVRQHERLCGGPRAPRSTSPGGDSDTRWSGGPAAWERRSRGPASLLEMQIPGARPHPRNQNLQGRKPGDWVAASPQATSHGHGSVGATVHGATSPVATLSAVLSCPWFTPCRRPRAATISTGDCHPGGDCPLQHVPGPRNSERPGGWDPDTCAPSRCAPVPLAQPARVLVLHSLSCGKSKRAEHWRFFGSPMPGDGWLLSVFSFGFFPSPVSRQTAPATPSCRDGAQCHFSPL